MADVEVSGKRSGSRNRRGRGERHDLTTGELSTGRAGAPRRVISAPRGLPTGRSVLGGLLVALAALGTYLVATHDRDGARSRYAVATHDLAPGTTIGPADVELVPLDLPAAQAAGTFADTSDLVGGALRGPVRSGSVLTDALVEHRRAAGAAPAETTAYREVSVALPAANAVDGSLRPGDRVDVVATDDDASFVLVDRALVVASSGGDRSPSLGGGDIRVTLALSDAAQALAVAHGAAAAKLTLVRSTRTADVLPETYHLPDGPAASATATTHRGS